MSWCKGFSNHVLDTVTELLMTCSDKAAPLSVEGMEDGEGVVAAVTVFGEVWGI